MIVVMRFGSRVIVERYLRGIAACLVFGMMVMGQLLPVAAAPLRQVLGWPKVSSPSSRPLLGKTGRFIKQERVYVPPAPRKAPSLLPGQLFFCSEYGGFGFVTPEGENIPPGDLALKLLLLRYVSPDLLIFSSEDGTKKYHLPLKAPCPDAESIPNLSPVVEDAEVNTLRKNYEGHFFIPYPGISVRGRMSNIDLVTSFRFRGAILRRLFRIRRRQPELLFSGWYRYSTYDPIVALFDTTLGVRYAGNGDELKVVGGEERDVLFSLSHAGKENTSEVACFGYFAGVWDLDRAFSRVTWEQMGESWPAGYKDAIAKTEIDHWTGKNTHRLQKGMTPDMVAWIMGWPAEYGSPDELRRLSQWRYSNGERYITSVYYKNGRVSKWYGPWRP